MVDLFEPVVPEDRLNERFKTVALAPGYARDVLALLREGLASREIAEQLASARRPST